MNSKVTENIKFSYDVVLYFQNNFDIFVEWVSAIPHREAKIKLILCFIKSAVLKLIVPVK